MSSPVPQKTKVLVVGGGPAGSYAAAALAREGIDVVLLEAAQFPRYHIGESLIPSVRHYLRFIGAEEKVASHGFARKPGSAIKFNQYMREGYTDFVALGADNAAWNVVRAEFDNLLLNHAAESGAQVFQRTRVLDFAFEQAEDTDLDALSPSAESSTPPPTNVDLSSAASTHLPHAEPTTTLATPVKLVTPVRTLTLNNPRPAPASLASISQSTPPPSPSAYTHGFVRPPFARAASAGAAPPGLLPVHELGVAGRGVGRGEERAACEDQETTTRDEGSGMARNPLQVVPPGCQPSASASSEDLGLANAPARTLAGERAAPPAGATEVAVEGAHATTPTGAGAPAKPPAGARPASAMGRPTRATYETADGTRGEIAFEYLVDATGRAGMLSTRYLKNRKFNEALRNVAVWGYWRGAGMYGVGTTRENAPWFEALSDESGWAWFIPLHNGLTSVGVVMSQKMLGARSRASSNASAPSPVSPSFPPPHSPLNPAFSPASNARPRADSSASAATQSPTAPSFPPPNSPSWAASIAASARKRSSSAASSISSLSSSISTSISSISASLGARNRSHSVASASTGQTSPVSARSAPSACASPGGGARHGHGGSPLAGRAASTLAPRYLAFLQLAPGVLRLLGGGELVCVDEESMCVFDGEGEAPPAVRSTSDFSYSADVYAGDGFRVVGDAGAFIDPFFSSGVHLAMTGGLAAAASIAASVRGDCTEAEAANWHSSRIAISYTRFLVVVLSAYKQIHAQSTNVLADIEEDNFDKAFAFLRPVIQGGAEMGARLSEDELQQALDFCVHLFSPTSPEQHEAVRQKLQELQREDLSLEGLGADLLDVRAPLIDPARLDAVSKRRPQRISTGAPASRGPQSAGNKDADVDSEVKMVLDKVNARRVIYSEHGNGLHSMEGEAVDGFVVRLEKGRLGLRKAGAEDGLVVRAPLDTAPLT